MKAEQIQNLRKYCMELQKCLDNIEFINDFEALVPNNKCQLTAHNLAIPMTPDVIYPILNEKKKLYEIGVMQSIVKINEEVK